MLDLKEKQINNVIIWQGSLLIESFPTAGLGKFYWVLTTDWLAQLAERQTTVREVEGSSPRPDQNSGS